MNSIGVTKYFPVQGSNKFQTVSFPITKAVMIDFGAQGSSGTATTFSLPKGSQVVGFTARVTEAYESSGDGTFQLGFSGTEMLTSAVTSAVAVLGACLGPVQSTAGAGVLTLSADDTFDVIIGTSGGATAGKVEVFITYVPIPVQALTSTDFLSYVTSS